MRFENDRIIARFNVVDEYTLVFAESDVPLFADTGARYVMPFELATSSTNFGPQEWVNYWRDEMQWDESYSSNQ